MNTANAEIDLSQLILEDNIGVTLSGSTFDRRTSQQSMTATLTNNSSSTISGPFVLAIENVTSGDVTVANHDDLSTSGTPVFAPSALNLEPNGSIQINLLFNNPNRVRFNFTPRVYRETSADNDPPVISITSPANNAVFTESPVIVSGTVTDQSEVTVTVNGVAANIVNGAFNATVPLSEGLNTLLATATDIAGNASSANIQVTLQTPPTDTAPPAITLIAPSNNGLVTEPRRAIELSYNDPSGVDLGSVRFTVNGNPFDADCGSLTETGGRCLPTADYPQGLVTLIVALSDNVGNEGSVQSQFTVDTETVDVAITSPATGFITKESVLDVSGSIGADVQTLNVNGVAANISRNAFSAQVPLREGTNMIVAVATKSSGKTGTDTVDVTQDIQAPIVQIQSPSSGFISAEKTIAVTGLANDIVNGATNPKVFVNGIEATVSNGAFMVMDVPLVRGPNTLTAIATDAVGNQGSHSVQVSFQEPVGVKMMVSSGNGQAGNVNQELGEPLVVQVTDNLGNPVAGRQVKFEVTRNSGALNASGDSVFTRMVQAPTDGSGKAKVRMRLGDTSGEGNNRVIASAVGVTGQVEFCASGLPSPAQKILMVEGDNQRGTINNPLATPFEALVVDKDGNPIPNLEVTFTVVKGGGSLNGASSLVRTTGSDGLARAVLTLGPEPGINNNLVSASFSGLTGAAATFASSGLAPGNPADTKFSGVVLDSGHTPIPGAIVSIPGTSASDTTDGEGQFLLENVPVGHIDLEIDPSNSPRPEKFPVLHFETTTVAGQTNILGQPIILPAINSETKVVGGDEDVTLVMPGVEGLTLTVFANSATFTDGSKTGLLSISQVHLDKVPMPPPSGTIFMPPAWTIQPAGTKFNPPARITIPNDGLPPGRVIDIFQFDHTLNEFINVGKGTVSDDGLIITSDPGFGITRAGWGGCGQPQPPTTCADNCPATPPSPEECYQSACPETCWQFIATAVKSEQTEGNCQKELCQGSKPDDSDIPKATSDSSDFKCKKCEGGDLGNVPNDEQKKCGDGSAEQDCLTCIDGKCQPPKCEASNKTVVLENNTPDYVIKALNGFQSIIDSVPIFSSELEPFIDTKLELGERCCKNCINFDPKGVSYRKFTGATGIKGDIKATIPGLGVAKKLPPKSFIGLTVIGEVFITAAGATVSVNAQGGVNYLDIDCPGENCGDFTLGTDFKAVLGPQFTGSLKLVSCDSGCTEDDVKFTILGISADGKAAFVISGFAGAKFSSSAQCGGNCIGGKVDPVIIEFSISGSVEFAFKKATYQAKTSSVVYEGGIFGAGLNCK